MTTPFAIMIESNSFPIKTLSTTFRINDIIYLQVGNIKFDVPKKIYCKVNKVNNKSIVVTDLHVKIINDKLNFYLDTSNSISKYFNNNYSIGRNIYVCDKEQFTY